MILTLTLTLLPLLTTSLRVSSLPQFEMFVITEYNMAQTALCTVWCSVHCDCGLCVD